MIELRVYTLNDMIHGMDRLVPGVHIIRIAETEGVGDVGLMCSQYRSSFL